MRKILSILLLLSCLNATSQNTHITYADVFHGDTLFRVRTVNNFSLDSVFRKEYQYNDQCDSVLVNDTMRFVCVTVKTDSVQYWYKFRTFTGLIKDSVQLNNIPHKTINSSPIIGTGNLTISGGAGISQQTLNDTATAIRTTVNGKSESSHTHAYNTLTGLPTLFDGNYNSLSNLPSIPTNTNQLTNGAGFLVAADIAGKQNNITLTTTGTSGAATFVGNTLNIPNYATGGGSSPTFLNLASNFSSTSTTPAVVTGWSFAVTTGKTYRITVIADYQTAATTTGGILGISLTTATGSVRGYASGTVVNTAAATELKIPIRTFSGAGSTLTTTGVTAINSPHYIGLDITFTCTNTGTFNIVWGTEVAASAAQLNTNSSLIYQELN